MSNNLPIPPNPGSYHGWAELLALLDGIRRLARDPSLSPDDSLRRIRDLLNEHDGRVI